MPFFRRPARPTYTRRDTYHRKKTTKKVTLPRRGHASTRKKYVAKRRVTFKPRAILRAKPTGKISGIVALPESLGGPKDTSVGHTVKVNARNKSGSIPDIMMTRFKWIARFPMQGGSAQQIFVQNNLADPDQTGLGDVVDYYYQFSRLYQDYRVNASKINIRCDVRNAATQETYVFLFPITSPSAGTIPGSIAEALVFPNQKHIILTPDTGPRGHQSLTHYCKIGALEGISNISASTAYDGGFATGSYTSPGYTPAIEYYWVAKSFPSQIGEAADFDMTVEIEFLTQCFNVVPSATSSPSLSADKFELTPLSDSVIINKFKELLTK